MKTTPRYGSLWALSINLERRVDHRPRGRDAWRRPQLLLGQPAPSSSDDDSDTDEDTAGASAASARPRLKLADLPGVLLQCVAEASHPQSYTAFAQTCTVFQAAAMPALQVVLLAEVARRLKAGKQVSNLICQKCPDLTVPVGPTRIQEDAFGERWALRSIVLPSGIKSIELGAFQHCGNLVSVVLQAGLASIGDQAFRSCYNLSSVVLPDSCTRIGDQAFSCCYNLTSVTLPASLIELGASAFTHCSISAINLPDTVTTIGGRAFFACSVITSIALPANLTSLGCNSFAECYSLESVTVPGGISEMDRYAFRGCNNLNAPSRESIRAVCPDAVF